MEINLNNFCDALRKSDRKNDAEDICETTGERYLIDNIISKFISIDRKSTRLNSSHNNQSRMPSSA